MSLLLASDNCRLFLVPRVTRSWYHFGLSSPIVLKDDFRTFTKLSKVFKLGRVSKLGYKTFTTIIYSLCRNYDLFSLDPVSNDDLVTIIDGSHFLFPLNPMLQQYVNFSEEKELSFIQHLKAKNL